MKITDDILHILTRCRVENNTIFLPEQLERKDYEAVNKCLTNIGGNWNRKDKVHIFDYDPAEAMEIMIVTGKTENARKKYQFFPTPRPVVEFLCDLAELDSGSDVLEPSVGRGDLADIIWERGPKSLCGVDIDKAHGRYLTGKPYETHTGVDFLEFAEDVLSGKEKSSWNRIVMNPPFSRQQDVDHIRKAFEILRDGGILVAVASPSPFFRGNSKSVEFRAWLESLGAETHELAEGMFKESGTNIRTTVIKIRKGVTQSQDSDTAAIEQTISVERNETKLKHSNVFYILAEDGFHAERNAIPVPNKAGLDLFRVGYNISDGKTGCRIKPHDTEADMLSSIKQIETDAVFRGHIETSINNAIADPANMSPRYTRPEEKYEEIFQPRPAGAAKRPRSERTQEDQAKYQKAVSDAEKVIYGKKPVTNTELNGLPVILCLFRENGVSIPKKTKDWIISSLYGAEFDERRHIWSFRYRGNLDRHFRGFWSQLEIAVYRKHGGLQLKGMPDSVQS
jgi:predicted RNA methylase